MLTTSSLALAALSPHLYMVHLYITLHPHPVIGAFAAYELDCFEEFTFCFGREAGKWVINALDVLSWEPLDRKRHLGLTLKAEVCVCMCMHVNVCVSMLGMNEIHKINTCFIVSQKCPVVSKPLKRLNRSVFSCWMPAKMAVIQCVISYHPDQLDH